MALRTSGKRLLAQLNPSNFQQVALFATKDVTPVKDWKAIQLPKEVVANIPTTIGGGQAFANDMRGTSGLGLGDGLKTHTDKWLSKVMGLC